MVASHRVAVLLALLAASPALAAVEGVVTTPDGLAIVGARVELVATGESRVTDHRGRFVFPEATPPATVLVEYPRFMPATLDVAAVADGELPRLVLVPKSEVYAEIVVSATRDFGEFEPVSVAAVSVSPADRPAPPSSAVELIEGIPSVAEDGQGGLFQAYSIRGIAGQRVRTSVAGARVETERRAGATASFVDPLLLGDADVVRGPSSTYYGSGALGGVVQLFPRRFAALEASAGYVGGAEAEAYQAIGWGDGDWSLGVSHRRAQDAETPDGEALFSRFEQWNATVARTWELASGAELDLLVLPAVAEDVGKPNTRIPERVTSYPEERHLLARASYRHPSRWRLDVFAHPNDLETRNVRSSSRSLVVNEALDFGLEAEKALDLGAAWTGRFGVDLFARRGVTATETVVETGTPGAVRARTLDGEQDEAAVFAAVSRPLGRATFEAGGRLTWIDQSNRGAGSEASADDTAATGFAGLVVPLRGNVELVANVGTGFRFPTLSERFFTGSTGRGEVVANDDLDPERSLAVDTGVRFYGRRLYVAGFVFRTEVDDYVEEVETADGVTTHVNLTSGTIEGVELEGALELRDGLRLTWAGQTQEGRADDGDALANVPADRAEVGLVWRRGGWSARGRFQHRFAKSDPGPGEKEIPSADLLSASVGWRLGADVLGGELGLHLFGDNLTGDTYFPSADELSVPAAGRSYGLGLRWGPRP